MDSTHVALELFDRVKGSLTDLAHTLKVPAEEVFALIVWQMQLRALGSIASLVLFGCLLLCVGKFGKFEDPEESGELAKVVVSIMLVAVGGLGLLASLICTASNALRLFNPEYYAITHIVDMLK